MTASLAHILAGECRSPARTISRSVLVAAPIIALMFILGTSSVVAFVGTGPIERQNPRRIALAHRQLRNSLFGPKLRQALGLPTDPASAKPAPKTTKKSAQPSGKEAA